MKCPSDCEGWDIGCEQIDALLIFCALRELKYTGPYFKFCPWCGERLRAVEQDQIMAIEWIIECVKKGAEVSQELIAMAEKELGALLGGPAPNSPNQADPEEIEEGILIDAPPFPRHSGKLQPIKLKLKIGDRLEPTFKMETEIDLYED